MYSNEEYIDLAKKLNIKFNRIANFKKAFYVKKVATVNGKSKDNYANAGLATLGDSILKTYITMELFDRGIQERGLITKLKEQLENNGVLLHISDTWELYKYVYDEHGGTVNRDPRLQIANSMKLRSTLLEAVIGSIYIDSDIQNTFNVLRQSNLLELINKQIINKFRS
ncbi:MAG: ribonuclease III domain-containing protein [Mycoplasma sp.]